MGKMRQARGGKSRRIKEQVGHEGGEGEGSVKEGSCISCQDGIMEAPRL